MECRATTAQTTGLAMDGVCRCDTRRKLHHALWLGFDPGCEEHSGSWPRDVLHCRMAAGQLRRHEVVRVLCAGLHRRPSRARRQVDATASVAGRRFSLYGVVTYAKLRGV